MKIINSKKTGVARLWELASLEKGFIFLSGIFAVASAVALYFPVVSVLFIIKELLPNVGDLSQANMSLLSFYGWLAVGGALGSLFFNFFALMFSHLAAFKTLYQLKIAFTTHLASLPMGFFSTVSTGQLRKIVDENIEKIEGFIAHQVPDIIGSLVTPVVVLCILFFVDWRFGLATFIPLMLAYGAQMFAYSKPEAQKAMGAYQDSLEAMNNASVEYVRGISVVKIFNQTIYTFRRFYQTIKTYSDWALSYSREWIGVMSFFMMITNFIFIFIVPLVIFILSGSSDLIDYVAISIFYLFFSAAVSAPFMKLMNVSFSMRQITTGVERMDAIFHQQALPEASHPVEMKGHDIVFDQVHFTYEGSEEAALKDVSFIANTSEITALVGPSGSGKSTIAHLIPRFYDVSRGAIRIGGADIKDVSHDDLMDQVSFVFQDVFLFKLSIIENLRIARKDATMEEVIDACKAAQCHEFIERLEHGYDTVIGTKNIHLSGGERQRLIIARAILKDAPILILDEATAFADPENEEKIQKAFEELMKDKTVIMIAHRLSTVQGANQIIVIDQGEIKEKGTHQDLIEQKGQYYHMWQQYTQALSWTIAAKGGNHHA